LFYIGSISISYEAFPVEAVRTAKLQHLLRQGEVWRGADRRQSDDAVLATGFARLDDLIGGGWPRGALVEILSSAALGLSLLVPVLARLGDKPAWLAWINSPYLPYAPRLQALGIDTGKILLLRKLADEQALWAAEQALRSGNCSMVMLWPGKLGIAQIRRLQLAAEAGACLGILFRPQSASSQVSAAALRLRVEADAQALSIQLLKRRGGWAGGSIKLASCFG
jgi:cell division inhibitor SulA